MVVRGPVLTAHMRWHIAHLTQCGAWGIAPSSLSPTLAGFMFGGATTETQQSHEYWAFLHQPKIYLVR